MKITVTDIARIAKVSRGTVDRALNNRGDISSEVKERILEIAKKHGYVKNHLASHLAKNITYNISVVLPDPREDVFWEAPLNGIKKREPFLKNYGFTLHYTFFSQFDKGSFTKAMEKVNSHKTDAILVAPIFYQESIQQLQIAAHNNVPVVCINSEINQQEFLTYIGQNSYDCGIIAGKLFDFSIQEKKKIITITLGHKGDNAVHIKNKIVGLQNYFAANNSKLEVRDFGMTNVDDSAAVKKVVKEILIAKDEIGGFLFTNSRAYHFKEKTDLFEVTKDYTKIGFDLIPQNIALLENDDLNFILNQNPYKQGFLGISSLFNHFIYNKQLPSKYYLPVDIIVAENYKQYLKDEEYSLQFAI